MNEDIDELEVAKEGREEERKVEICKQKKEKEEIKFVNSDGHK